MARKIYENDETLNNEKAFQYRIGTRLGVGFNKMPRSYRMDFAVTKGKKVLGFAEFKCRTNASDKYPTYLLSLGKWTCMSGLRKATGLRCSLFVEFTDKIMRYNVAPNHKPKIEIAGRIDRGDPEDVEPCVMIPMEWFEVVE